MIEIEKIKEYLKDTLSEKRYIHSLGVAEEAVSLARHYGADEDKAYIAGLCHDVAKEIPNDIAKYMLKEKYGAVLSDVEEVTHKLLHGPLGAYMAQSEFGISDIEIIDAIKYHTTAKANMSMLCKIIYMADYTEKNRTYEGVEELRELSFKNLDDAIIFGIDFTIGELIEKGAAFHPDTIDARNYILLKRLKS